MQVEEKQLVVPPATKTDWYFIAWIVLTIAGSAVFIGLSIAFAAASLATPLRQSKGKQITLWALAIGMTLLSLMPHLIHLFPVTIVTEYDATP